MVGFVGAQARRRRRNRVILVFLVLLIFIFVFYLPTFNFSIEENELPNEILPNTVDDQSSLISEIEELKLEIFQKDQRIKFRDNQINDLKDKNRNLKQSFASLQTEYEKSVGSFSDLQSNSSQNSLENINEIKILENKIKKLNDIIKNYKNEINKLNQSIEDSVSTEDFKNINIENSILKNEIKLIKEKNLEAENILYELQNLINEKQKKIDELLYLKDQQHHG